MKYGYSGGLVISSDDIIVPITHGDNIVLLIHDIEDIIIKNGSFLLLKKLK